jgi:hypothetical protein
MSSLDGKVCTDAELALAALPDPSMYCLTRGQSIGLTVGASLLPIHQHPHTVFRS